MAGLTKDSPYPTNLILHQQSKLLEIHFTDGAIFKLPFELLRVYSPSADVRGHSPEQEVLQTGKRHVGILNIESIGHYAIKPVFSDGHESGIYSWDFLYELGKEEKVFWQVYEAKLKAAQKNRDDAMPEKKSAQCHI